MCVPEKFLKPSEGKKILIATVTLVTQEVRTDGSLDFAFGIPGW